MRRRAAEAARRVAEVARPYLEAHRRLIGPVSSQMPLGQALRQLVTPRDSDALDAEDIRACETVRAVGMYALGLSARGEHAPREATHASTPPEVWSLDDGTLPGDPALLEPLRTLHQVTRAAQAVEAVDALPPSPIRGERVDFVIIDDVIKPPSPLHGRRVSLDVVGEREDD